MPTPDLVPDAAGSGYRLYTIQHVPFDRFPVHEDGGPALVPHGPWRVSYSRHVRVSFSPAIAARGDGKVGLSVHRFEGNDPVGGAIVRSELDGTRYPTGREATRAAYEGGYLAFMVPEQDAPRFGLTPDE
jgi:hypothetical protein